MFHWTFFKDNLLRGRSCDFSFRLHNYPPSCILDVLIMAFRWIRRLVLGHVKEGLFMHNNALLFLNLLLLLLIFIRLSVEWTLTAILFIYRELLLILGLLLSLLNYVFFQDVFRVQIFLLWILFQIRFLLVNFRRLI